MRERYPEEHGTTTINQNRFEWTMRRSKGESCFGIRGSRIFMLTINKEGKRVCSYDRGWEQKPLNEDEDVALCIAHLVETYGRQKKKEKKEKKKV